MDLLDLLPVSRRSRGRMLRLLREVRGEAQRAAENSAGLGRGELSAIERGRRDVSDRVLRDLLRHYRADPTQLVLLALLLGEIPWWRREGRREDRFADYSAK